MTDDYDDLMRERDRFEEQNGELNVENQELRAQLETTTYWLHKMTEQRDGWSSIARQFARMRSSHVAVVRMVGKHLRKQTEENIHLSNVVDTLIPEYPPPR